MFGSGLLFGGKFVLVIRRAYIRRAYIRRGLYSGFYGIFLSRPSKKLNQSVFKMENIKNSCFNKAYLDKSKYVGRIPP